MENGRRISFTNRRISRSLFLKFSWQLLRVPVGPFNTLLGPLNNFLPLKTRLDKTSGPLLQRLFRVYSLEKKLGSTSQVDN